MVQLEVGSPAVSKLIQVLSLLVVHPNKHHYEKNGNEITLFEPQIVNGAQTSKTISDSFRLFDDIPGEILVTIIKETDRTTRNDITRFRNSQNAVKGKDLIALDKFHTGIRGQLSQLGYYYEQQALYDNSKGNY